MIISHRHKFIFVKTHKTAGSSLEVALAGECGPEDVVSHMEDNIASGVPRNYGPSSAIGPLYNRNRFLRKLVSRHSPLLGEFYYEHMPAWRIRELLGEKTWSDYFTFCFERNPWDKVVSYYFWKREGQGRAMPSFADYVQLKAHRLPIDSALYRDRDSDALLVDRVFEFRELGSALQELRERLGLSLAEPLPREKTGVAVKRAHYSTYYDETTRERVRELFASEIALMGYTFEDDAAP